jgi:DNA-binding NtrC family response regulator
MGDVLIVDDEERIRELLTRWITAAGHAVTPADSAEAALDALASHPFGVVTIDKDMGGQNGVWLVEQIQDKYPGVAMLLATGDDQIAPRIATSRGIQGYLVKPFNRDSVVEAIASALAWHKVAAKQAAKRASSGS